jgi:hypothetical protein
LSAICEAIADLQEQRHRADYETAASFTRIDATGFVALARHAHALWPSQRTTHNAQAFMLASAKLLRAR